MFDAGFVRAAVPSFEPGGQLELSPPPRPTVGDLAADVAVLSRRATAIAAARGIRLEAVGLNPYHSCADVPLHLPTPRYLAPPDCPASTVHCPGRPAAGRKEETR